MEQVVYKTLSTDSLYRKSGVTGDLIALSNLKQKDWDYSLPTLVKEGNVFLKDKIRSLTNETYCTAFYKSFPELKNLDWNNIIVAGGCAGGFIYGKGGSDIDFFIYGLNQEQATDKVEHIFNTIKEYEKNKYIENMLKNEKNKNKTKKDIKVTDDDLHMEFVRTKNTLTLNGKYQVIFRIYTSVSEILHGFDLGSSAIGFNGYEVRFTSLGLFAYEYLCNIVDTTRRSTSYEHRLLKYLDRGFEIICPDMDINKLTTRMTDSYDGLFDICEMPYLTFTYKGRSGNKIHFNRSYIRKNNKNTQSDHDYIDIKSPDEYALFYVNILHLLQQNFGSLIYLSDNCNKIIREPKCFSSAKVTYFYEQLEDKIQQRDFPTKSVEKYITVMKSEDVFALRNNPSTLKVVFNEQLKLVKDLLVELENKDKQIAWLVQDPGTQLTGSFNPIIEDKSKWYGEYYKQFQN